MDLAARDRSELWRVYGQICRKPPDEAAEKTSHTPSHRASPRYMGAKGLKE